MAASFHAVGVFFHCTFFLRHELLAGIRLRVLSQRSEQPAG